MAMTELKNGSRIRFLRPDGAVMEDTVRGPVFEQTELLAPYAPNRTFQAVVLTEHSWCPVDSIIEVIG